MHPSLYTLAGTFGPSNNIAAFDLDWTLVRTVHARFPKDANDWAFLPNRLEALKFYRDRDYTIVIFTNQGYKGARLSIAIERITNIMEALGREKIHPWVLIATGPEYRKPHPGMWETFAQHKPNISKVTSFYVGDAAGRPQDHSDDDRLFAQNIGLPFYTPEEIFPANTVTIPATQTMFIFVGMPGSGKSTYYEQNLRPLGWVHANQDILKTQAKMLSAIEAALKVGKSVAVDATNPELVKRRNYLILAQKYQVPTLILYFVRNGYDWNKLRPHPVPDIAYNIYFKHLEEPTLETDSVPVIEIS